MNKVEIQRQFIDIMKRVLKENPNIEKGKFKFFIYSELVRLYTKKEDYDIDLSSEFKDWDQHFSDINNIEAYYSPVHKSFYQFRNKSDKLNAKTAIKLYIPMDYNHITKGVKDLFSFIAKEDIINSSKVRKKITLDNVVIRVNNIKDAEKIIEYVSNNEYIKEGLMPPNPFLIDKDNIAIAMDGYNTYNGYLSSNICNYLYENNLDNASLEGFEDYLININDKFKKYSNDIDDDNSNLIKLSLKSVNKTSDYNEFKQYAEIRNYNHQNNIDKKEVLNNALTVLIRKYGIDIATKHLDKYIETGNITLFSREDNTRENIKLYLNQKSITDIVEEYNNPEEYMDILMNFDKDKEKIEILNQASKLTYQKYGQNYPTQLKKAIYALIAQNNYSLFTNDENIRVKLKLNVLPEEVLDLIKNYLLKNDIDLENKNVLEIIDLYNRNIKEQLTINNNMSK